MADANRAAGAVPPTRIVTDVTCTRCGCLCDDLVLHLRGEAIWQAEGACSRALPFFLDPALRQTPAAVAWCGGQPATVDEALSQAAALLRQARAPLICGLSSSSTAGRRAALRLADRLGATIDTTGRPCHAAPLLAMQSVGQVTCSLGEVRHRADLVVYWRADPAITHPRLQARFVEASGSFCPGGRADRHLLVVDTRLTATAASADEFLPLPVGSDLELLSGLRAILRDVPLAAESIGGVPLTRLRELAARWRSCRYGVIFFGARLAEGDVPHAPVEMLLRLVAELNQCTRFRAVALSEGLDAHGADNVLAWQTGYSGSVNLAHRYPRAGPDEYGASLLLERGEVDALLLIGSDFAQRFSPAASDALRTIPVIVLDDPTVTARFPAAVDLVSAVYGVHQAATAYRLDDVCLPVKAWLPRRLPTDAQLLDALLARLSPQPCYSAEAVAMDGTGGIPNRDASGTGW